MSILKYFLKVKKELSNLVKIKVGIKLNRGIFRSFFGNPKGMTEDTPFKPEF